MKQRAQNAEGVSTFLKNQQWFAGASFWVMRRVSRVPYRRQCTLVGRGHFFALNHYEQGIVK